MKPLDLAQWRRKPYQRIAVLGGGAWGAALAATARRAGRDVTLWARREEIVRDINENRRNSAYLDDVVLPEGVRASTDLAETVADAEAVLLVTPSASIRQMARSLSVVLPASIPVIVCAKGIEPETGLLMTQIVTQEMPGQPVGALSGPTFAAEVARELPTAVTVASAFDDQHGREPETSIAARMALALSGGVFRVYVSDDLVGVEVGGAMKNVLAIACGVAEGARFGANMRAALITRGLDEMKRLAEAIGGRRETVTGLSGLGDLTLTCSSELSRNLRFGLELGRGVKPENAFDGQPVVVEGAPNSVSVTDLARKHGLDLPICETVRAIVHDRAEIAPTLIELWSRPLEAEPKALDLALDHPARDTVGERMGALIG